MRTCTWKKEIGEKDLLEGKVEKQKFGIESSLSGTHGLGHTQTWVVPRFICSEHQDRKRDLFEIWNCSMRDGDYEDRPSSLSW